MADEEEIFENAETGKIVENENQEKELVRDDVIKEKVVGLKNVPRSKEENGDLKGKGEEGKNEVVKDDKEKNGGLENKNGVEENGDVKNKAEGKEVESELVEGGITKGVDEEGESKKVDKEKDVPKKIDDEKDKPKKIDDEKDELKKIDKEKDEPKKIDKEKDEPTNIDKEKDDEPKKIENDKDESKKIDEGKEEPKKIDKEKDEPKSIDKEKDESKKIGKKNDETKKIDKEKDEPKKNGDENDESKKIEKGKDEPKKVDEEKDGSKKEGENNTRGYQGIGKTKEDEKNKGVNQENSQSNKVEEEKNKSDASNKEDETKESGDQEERDDAISCNVDVNNVSFKEQANQFSELKENEKSALVELKTKLEEAIKGNTLFKEEKTPPINLQRKGSKLEGVVEEALKKKQEESKKPEEGEKDQQEKQEQEGKEIQDTPPKDESIEEKSEAPNVDIALWGIPLLPSKGDNQTDVLLLKFLRARDYKSGEAFEMLRNTLQWRKQYNIDSILDEDFANDFSPAAYMSGVDNEGHPVCYNIFGALDNNEMYNKTLSSQERQDRFLRWRIQLMEKGIQKLDFSPTGVSSLLQISDLKNTPGPSKKEVRLSAKQGVSLLLDNYPEFVAKHIFINVPFWYYAFTAVLSPFLNARTKSKFVYARPAKVTETLLKYIAIEELPVQYGGLKRENDPDFSHEDNAIEVPLKAGSSETIELLAPEVGRIVWDLTVLGWEVSYKEEFVPNDEGSYTIIVQKGRKIGAQDVSIRNSFRSNEPGKIVISIDNSSFKKKRVFYRYKSNTSSSSS